MAEKKVSGKNKNGNSREKTRVRHTDTAYDDFIVKYGPDLRKRSTRTVSEPKKNTERPADADSSRCGEINPHLAVNPAAEHHILTKRSERILADDTGFKAQDYYQRFDLKPEMPEVKEEDSIPAEEGFEESVIPGQQTMADMVAENAQGEEIAVPVESKIIQEEEDLFSSAYKAIKGDTPFFGKSEKLRAIARTASDDVGMEPESQLSFPAFDPLFRFDETDKKKKSRHIRKKDKNAEKTQQPKDFDIEEESLVTSRVAQEEEIEDVQPEPEENTAKIKKHRFFRVIDNGEFQEEEPVFEINSKHDIRGTSENLKKIGRMYLVKTGVLIVLGLVAGILSVTFSNSVKDGTYNSLAFAITNVVFLIIAGVFCIKELVEGIKDILKKKFTLNSGGVLIFTASVIQVIAAAASPLFPQNIRILTSAAILSMTAMTIPRLLLTNNSRLAVSIMGSSNSVSLFRPLSDGGIEGAVSAAYASDGTVRCNTKVQLASGIMKRLTNAIPKPFAGNATYIFAIGFSLTAGIAASIITRSFSAGVTVLSAMLMACLPLSYTLAASFLLFRENNSLAEKKSSVISYKSAGEVTKTKSVLFDVNDITEGSSCSIHSIRTFGITDPKKATLCCAAAINAGNSPLVDIINQVVEQGEEEIPEADDFLVCKGGIAALVDGNKVLLGAKEFLTKNHVAVPEEDIGEELITGDRKPLFLSVNGEFCMLLIVSYHIKRSVATFFKYLAEKDISILIHSSDPNITPEYIEKKCRLPEESVFALSETESAFFRDKAGKTETSLEADVFTDGKPLSVFALMKSSFRLEQASAILPTVIFVLALTGALAVCIPSLLGNIVSVGNLYIIILKIICTVLTAAVPLLISKK